MRFACVNLGCKVNRVEADSLTATLLGSGHTEVAQEEAQLVVVNTCTVTGEAEKKTRKAVRHALRAAPEADVLVTGCAAAIDPSTYTSMSPRVRVVPKNLLVEEARACAAQWGEGDEFCLQGGLSQQQLAAVLAGETFRTRVGVKVQDGCNNACTYCIVHTARGRAVSYPAEGVVAQCVALADAGVREIVLSGINLGSYVQNGPSGGTLRLAGLLKQLLAATCGTAEDGLPRVRFRIGSIEPRDVSDALVQVMAQADGRICRHLHLPLQSGSSRVLRQMARPYSADFFCALVERMRAAMPGLALSTDIIAGFPGETSEDFAQTLDVARACGFMKIHAFPYSLRTGTPAAARDDQVDAETKGARAAQLRELSESLAAADRAQRSGSTELALVEGAGRATTESYHEVLVADCCPSGSLVPYTFG